MLTTQKPFLVLVPVKNLDRAKTRLGPAAGFDTQMRERLARAFALDALQAAATSTVVGHVCVVSADTAFIHTAKEHGIDGEQITASIGLNDDLIAGAARLRERLPNLTPVAMCADLPALRADDLTAALATIVPGERAFVADSDRTGTTLYSASYDRFRPQFGRESRQAHLQQGCREIAGRLISLRRDVDDQAGLAAARELGVGASTRSVLAAEHDRGNPTQRNSGRTATGPPADR